MTVTLAGNALIDVETLLPITFVAFLALTFITASRIHAIGQR